MSTDAVRVVVVDDQPDLRLLMSVLLESDDRFVFAGEAADGGAGLRAIADAMPDMVVVDLAMPGVDGLELLGHCNTQWPDLPIAVVLSGFNRATMWPVAQERGAVGYIEKGVLVGAQILDELWNIWTEHLVKSGRQTA